MATYRAISTGVYSALARWQVSTDGGVNWSAATQLPVVGDGVYSNGFAITVDVDSFASFYARTASTGVVLGGGFLMGNNRTMVGDILAPGSASSQTLYVNALNTPTYLIGDVGGGIGNDSRGVLVQNTTGQGVFTVIGDVQGAFSFHLGTTGILAAVTVGVVVIGNVFSASGHPALRTLGGAAIQFSVVGRSVGTSSTQGAFAAICDEIEGVGTGCKVRNKIIIPFQGCALPQIAAGFKPVIEYADELGAVITYNDLNAQDQASPADVRLGTSYANGALTGTCAVPPAGAVSLGVPVDNTVGSYTLPVDNNAIAAAISSSLEVSLPPLLSPPLAADLLDEISTSSNALAERLRNVSTVQTTGTQISALTLS